MNAQGETFCILNSSKDGPRDKPGAARVIGSSKFPSDGATPGSSPGLQEWLALSEKARVAVPPPETLQALPGSFERVSGRFLEMVRDQSFRDLDCVQRRPFAQIV